MPVTTNSALANFLDHHASDRLTGDFHVHIPRLTTVEEMSAVAALAKNPQEADVIRHQAIEMLRRSEYAGLTTLLIVLIDAPEERERFRSFVAQHLGMLVEPDVITFVGDADRIRAKERLVALLNDRHAAVRREALLALARVRDEQAITIVRTGLDDPAWHEARDLIVRCAGELDQRALIPRIRPLAFDDNAEIRIAALNALGSWRDAPSIAAFREARQSGIVRVQNAGAAALRRWESESPSP